MLKAITKTDIEGANFKSKCGEIHYLEGNWHYFCVFCELISGTNDDFCNHLISKHLNEFVFGDNSFFKGSTDSVDDFKSKLVDPLRCSPIEKSYKSDALTVNTESAQKYVIEHDCDDTISGCDVKINDFQDSLAMVSDNNDRSESHVCRETKEMDTSDELGVEMDRLSVDEFKNEAEIDWNTPFKPTYLKNSEKRPYRSRKQPFTCTYCGRTFRRRYQFDTHLHIHTGAKPHQCEICGRQFRAVATLQRHLNTHEQRSFVCSFCNKSFSHRPALLSHETRHTQERNEPCDFCEKRFYTLNQLDTHKRRVHKKSNEELPFACDVCSKRYRTNSMLSIHKGRKHYKTAEFQCEKCNKKFVDLQRLEEHKNIHVDKRALTQNLNATKES